MNRPRARGNLSPILRSGKGQVNPTCAGQREDVLGDNNRLGQAATTQKKKEKARPRAEWAHSAPSAETGERRAAGQVFLQLPKGGCYPAISRPRAPHRTWRGRGSGTRRHRIRTRRATARNSRREAQLRGSGGGACSEGGGCERRSPKGAWNLLEGRSTTVPSAAPAKSPAILPTVQIPPRPPGRGRRSRCAGWRAD